MMSDLRFALRQLRKSKTFTLTAIVTLALGIGVNTAIFSLIESIMLRPLPFPQQDRLTRIAYSETEVSFFPKGWIRALADHSQSFRTISGFGPDTEFNIAAADASERVFGAQVLTNAFDTLQIRPALGDFFSREQGVTGNDAVAVLSYGFWQQRFGQSATVLGQTIRVDGVSRRIIGVMPPGVRFPYADTQIVIPVAFKGGDPIDPWRGFDLNAFGRLKSGVTPRQAQAELRRLHGTLMSQFPWRMPDVWGSAMTVIPLLEAETGATRPRLLLLFAAGGLILLIACANVGNLMLARAAGREREMAVRGALGASRGRLIRQLLLESLLLAILAGAAGLATAALSLQALLRLLPPDTPRLNDVGLHWPVFAFAGAVSLLTGFLFGLIPAFKMASPDLQEALRSGGRGIAGKAGNFRLSMALVMSQVALSVVVVTSAGLMLHSLYSLTRVDPGFHSDRVVTAEVSLDASACQQRGRCTAFFTSLRNVVQGIAGTESVAFTDALPMSGRDGNFPYDAEGHPRNERQGALMATTRTVSSDYFSTLGIRLIEGRTLADQDGSVVSRAVVISQGMAQRLWPHQDPIGKHIMDVNDEPRPAVWDVNDGAVVVGVAANTHDSGLAGSYGDEVYLPMSPSHEQPVMYVLIRTRASSAESAAGLRRAVAQLDALAPVTRVRTLNELLASSVAAPRSLTLLFLSFGILSFIIGGVGVYSLIAYIVSWRTREIAIRLALGVVPWQVVLGVMKQSLLLVTGGTAAGLLLASLVANLLHSFLFGISALDPLTFLAVPGMLFLLALVAAWIPAQRAASVDPMQALRNE